MSRDNKTHTNSREERKKLWVRIFCLFLAFLMIGGMAYYTIYILATGADASERTNINEVIVTDTSSLKNSGDVLISVGLMYGSSITKGFETVSENGYSVGWQNIYDDREYCEVWDIDISKISCTVDDNLSKTDMTYLVSDSRSDTVVGGYHIEISDEDFRRSEIEDLIDETERKLDRMDLYAIPSYIDGEYAIRVGSFSSAAEADMYLEDIEDIFDLDAKIVRPTNTAVSVVDPETDRILFEFDCNAELELGLCAHEDSNGNTYIKTPAGNTYDGVFCFKRYDNGDTYGVELMNILPLEAYVAGVLPYEIDNMWPLETMKAFAITVRSYTLTHLGKHMDRYGFDLCNTTDCQVYKGSVRINDNVMKAVLGTRGQVLTYNDEIVTAYYSSSMGDSTVSAYDAWGVRDVPYLQAIQTPWEDYSNHNNGFWIYEVSPEAIAERLNKAGYEAIKDSVSSIKITELAENSSYVKELTVTDIHGTSIIIQYSDNVRVALSPYVKSANFVVGKGNVRYTSSGSDAEAAYRDADADEPKVYDISYAYSNIDELYVLTSSDFDRNTAGVSMRVLTGNGDITYQKSDAFVMTKLNAAAFLGDEYLKYSENDKKEVTASKKTEIIGNSDSENVDKIVYADNEKNFIFVGKGWGHGVGMSQYGAYDMGKSGYIADEILSAYFNGATIVDYDYFG